MKANLRRGEESAEFVPWGFVVRALPSGTTVPCRACVREEYVSTYISIHQVQASKIPTPRSPCKLVWRDVYAQVERRNGTPYAWDVSCGRLL